MLTDKISVITLEDFVKKVRIASKSNQKTFNLTITEAENLAFHLNLIVLKLLDKHQNEETKNETENDVIVISMDGGGFEEKR